MPSSISSSRPAQRALLKLAACFALVLALAVGASEWLVRTHVIPQDTYASHVTLLQTVERPDAAFGDSHTARGFVAGRGFVNLAFPSEGVPHMAWKVGLHYADRAPGRVILQADPHLFAAYRLYRSFEPYPEIIAPPGRDAGLRILEPRHRVRLPGYWSRFLENGFHLQSKVQQTADGALLSPGDFSALEPRAQWYEARTRALTHRPGPAHLVQSEQRDYAAMLDDLAARGATLCMVTYPVTQAYLDAVGVTHRPLLQYFEAEATRVGAVYVDARRLIQDQSLFRDADHLNAHGARVFSSLLEEACFGTDRTLAALGRRITRQD